MASRVSQIPHFFKKLFTSDAIKVALEGNAIVSQNSSEQNQKSFHDWLSQQLDFSFDRTRRYAEYEIMEAESPEVATALNFFADDATQTHPFKKKSVWINARNPMYNAVLSDLLDNTLKIEDHIWGIARAVAKKGDHFRRMYITEVDKDTGISDGCVGWRAYPASYIRRIQKPNGQLWGFKRDTHGMSMGQGGRSSAGVHNAGAYLFPDEKDFYHPWDFVHFRILGDEEDPILSMYGKSMIEASRSIWKRMKLLEESVFLYRIQKAPDRLVFYLDVATNSPPEAKAVMRRWQHFFKRKRFLNPFSQKFESNFNPIALDEDIWFPMMTNKQSRVEKLPGSPDVRAIADIDYFKDKFYLSLSVPREYLSGDGTSVIQIGGGQSLAQKDVRYARSVKRLQRAIIRGLTRACQIHLAALGLDPDPALFSVEMTEVSSLEEQQRMDVLQMKVNAAQQTSALLQDLEITTDARRSYVFEKILVLSQEEIKSLTPAPPQQPPASAAPSQGQPAQQESAELMGLSSLLEENEVDSSQETEETIPGVSSLEKLFQTDPSEEEFSEEEIEEMEKSLQAEDAYLDSLYSLMEEEHRKRSFFHESETKGEHTKKSLDKDSTGD